MTGADELRTILWDVKSGTFQVFPEDSAKKDISFSDPAQSPDGKLVAVRNLDEELAIWYPDTRIVRSPISKTKVISVRFVDNTELVFLSWDWWKHQRGDFRQYM